MKNCKLCGVCPVCVERVRRLLKIVRLPKASKKEGQMTKRTVKAPGKVWDRAIFIHKCLGNNVICKCGATVDTLCTAELSFPCEGFLAIEAECEGFRTADKEADFR